MTEITSKQIVAMSLDDLRKLAKRDDLSTKTQENLLKLAFEEYEASVRDEVFDNYRSYEVPEYVCALGANPSLASRNIKRLALMKSECVICALAENSSTPSSVLESFVDDNSYWFQGVLSTIILNPNCNRTLALKIALLNAEDCKDEDIYVVLQDFVGWTESDLKRLADAGVEGF